MRRLERSAEVTCSRFTDWPVAVVVVVASAVFAVVFDVPNPLHYLCEL